MTSATGAHQCVRELIPILEQCYSADAFPFGSMFPGPTTVQSQRFPQKAFNVLRSRCFSYYRGNRQQIFSEGWCPLGQIEVRNGKRSNRSSRLLPTMCLENVCRQRISGRECLGIRYYPDEAFLGLHLVKIDQ